jgi:hypothetical protein
VSCALSIHKKECRKSLGCALSIEKYGTCFYDVLMLFLETAMIFSELPSSSFSYLCHNSIMCNWAAEQAVNTACLWLLSRYYLFVTHIYIYIYIYTHTHTHTYIYINMVLLLLYALLKAYKNMLSCIYRYLWSNLLSLSLTFNTVCFCYLTAGISSKIKP